MWRRIHSNRDPRDTLYSELRKEFGSYFNKAGGLFNRVLFHYPKFFFGAMVLFMLVSLILSFTLFRQPKPPGIPVASKSVNPVGDGFGQILQATGRIRETMLLKQRLDSITAKKQLSGADSAFLDSALNTLEHNQPITH